MLPCTLPDAGVTVLVLPLVSLRGDLLRRVRELGIDHLGAESSY
jgi:superfamily II DNA helicase RecQ